ncbi:hypothetical protein BZA05DRAFT_413728 [Tricharina praecox]|uniref:uncharacterized protein n=1 Tax=Tricharina praecox TaxID=43433 RepID=UPI00221FB04B|nr:uncharacterized protein BZA05DRAFT_413728 [Tricharina praecox]KAI5840914.1 hypothetical protein BZA05DRAFT_413728 [Tricharina praecox]
MTTFHPHHPEHAPPSYLDRDTDLVSLRSAAPSYTSSLPPTYSPRTYTSLIPAHMSSTPELIPAHHAYNVASWPSLSNQSQSRAYLNVAARRARRAQEEAQAGIEADAVRRALRMGMGQGSAAGASRARLDAMLEEEGDAVGFEDALRMESRSWDFFTAQMSDWEHRQVSWKAFKARHEKGSGSANGKGKKGKGKASRWGFYGRLG